LRPPSRDIERPPPDHPGTCSLDARFEGLLESIENEAVPERLLTLALELQAELAARRKRRDPD
jgi:hypothetical protein